MIELMLNFLLCHWDGEILGKSGQNSLRSGLLEYVRGAERKFTVDLQNDLIVSLTLERSGWTLEGSVRFTHLFRGLKSLLNNIFANM